MTAEVEDVLFTTMTDAGFSYVSFPAFVENESSVDVFDIVCRAMEAYAAQREEETKQEIRDYLIGEGYELLAERI